jgi:PAS domain S-box-containing protein
LKLKNRLVSQLLVRSQAMVSLVFQLQHTIQTEAALLHQRSISLIIAFFILFAFIVLGILLWIKKSVAKPITALEEGARIIGSGNLNHKIGTDAKNEIGHLSRAFDKMAMDLKETTTSIGELNKEIVERKKVEKEVQESNEKFKQIVQGNSIPTFIIDGATEKEIDEYYEVKIDKSTLIEGAYEGERFFPDLGEKGRWLFVTATPLRDQNKNIIAVIETLQDITERKSTERQLQQAQKMESVGRLAGGVAHDYNNALSVIMGFTEITMTKMDPAGPMYANLNEVLKAARRARDITRQLLAFARKQTISPKVLDLNGTIDSMLKMLRHLIGEDIDLAWLPATGLWPIKMDPSQIDQILANLCVNARDAIDGVGKITVETDGVVFDAAYCADHVGFVPGEFVMLSLSDNGCGMNKEILDNIFEPFFTTKDVDKGTGLGLAMVYGIVKQNNGFINVYSEPDKGTTIKIYLPRHEGKAAEIQGENTEKIPQGQGETILVVEDDLSILNLTKKILDGLGYIVLIAATPDEAMDVAREHSGRIHLVVTDVIMPEMNGRELSELLKSIYPDLNCIFMSGYTTNAIVHHGVLDEGTHFVQKPFSKNDLATIVRKVLDRE